MSVEKKNGPGKNSFFLLIITREECINDLFRRSLSLIQSLLYIADGNTHATIFEIFRRGITVALEFIFLGLLQVQVCTRLSVTLDRSASIALINTETNRTNIDNSFFDHGHRIKVFLSYLGCLDTTET